MFENEFIAFCTLNGIYTEIKQDENDIKNKVIEETIINNNFIIDKSIEKIDIDNEEKENNDDSCIKAIEAEHDDSTREETIQSSEKGIFL